MSGATATGWALLGLALLFVLAGAVEAGLFASLAGGLAALMAPTEEQADARRRNPRSQARPMR